MEHTELIQRASTSVDVPNSAQDTQLQQSQTFSRGFATWRPRDDEAEMRKIRSSGNVSLFLSIALALNVVATAAITVFGGPIALSKYMLFFPCLLACPLACNSLFTFIRAKVRGGTKLDVPGIGNFLVEAEFRKNNVPYAYERGEVFFEDGYLVFESATTSFSFSRSGISLPPRKPKVKKMVDRIRNDKRPWASFDYVVDADTFGFGMKVLGEHSKFEAACRGWFNSTPASAGHSVYPPKTPTLAALAKAREDASNSLWGGSAIVVAVIANGSLMQWTRYSSTYPAPVSYAPNPTLLEFCLTCALITFCSRVLIPYVRANRWAKFLEKEFENN